MTHYTENCSRKLAGCAVELDHGFRQTVARWFAAQRLKLAIHRERRQLAQLTGHQLRDIGLDRSAAVAEAARRDIPRNRLA